MRVAVPMEVLLEEGGVGGRLAADRLSTAHSTAQPRVPKAQRGVTAADRRAFVVSWW